MKKTICVLLAFFLMLLCGCKDSSLSTLDEVSSFDYKFSKVYETIENSNLNYFKAKSSSNSVTIVSSKTNLDIIKVFIEAGNMISSVLSAYSGISYSFILDEKGYHLDKIIVSDSGYELFNYSVSDRSKIIKRISTEYDYVRNTTMFQALQKQIYENKEFLIIFEEQYIHIERK